MTGLSSQTLLERLNGPLARLLADLEQSLGLEADPEAWSEAEEGVSGGMDFVEAFHAGDTGRQAPATPPAAGGVAGEGTPSMAEGATPTQRPAPLNAASPALAAGVWEGNLPAEPLAEPTHGLPPGQGKPDQPSPRPKAQNPKAQNPKAQNPKAQNPKAHAPQVFGLRPPAQGHPPAAGTAQQPEGQHAIRPEEAAKKWASSGQPLMQEAASKKPENTPAAPALPRAAEEGAATGGADPLGVAMAPGHPERFGPVQPLEEPFQPPDKTVALRPAHGEKPPLEEAGKGKEDGFETSRPRPPLTALAAPPEPPPPSSWQAIPASLVENGPERRMAGTALPPLGGLPAHPPGGPQGEALDLRPNRPKGLDGMAPEGQPLPRAAAPMAGFKANPEFAAIRPLAQPSASGEASGGSLGENGATLERGAETAFRQNPNGGPPKRGLIRLRRQRAPHPLEPATESGARPPQEPWRQAPHSPVNANGLPPGLLQSAVPPEALFHGLDGVHGPPASGVWDGAGGIEAGWPPQAPDDPPEGLLEGKPEKWRPLRAVVGQGGALAWEPPANHVETAQSGWPHRATAKPVENPAPALSPPMAATPLAGGQPQAGPDLEQLEEALRQILKAAARRHGLV